MVDHFNEGVQIINDLLEGAKVVIHSPGQRVSKQHIPKRVPACYNGTSLKNMAEYGEERWVQIPL